MRLTAILVLLGWCALTASPAVALLRRGRRRALALAGLAGTLFTVVLWLLLLIEWLPFFGDAWHKASVWLNLAIGLAALNLALAFSCLLFLPVPGPASPRAAPIVTPIVATTVALVCFWLAMAIVAAAGANDRFLYEMKFSAPLVGLTVCLLILALAGALVVWRATRR